VFNFVELEHFSKANGWSMETVLVLIHPITISFIGTLIFSILGAFALRKQIQKIRSEGARAVSIEWNLVFLATFIALMPYGFERDELAPVIQCVMRAPFYVLILQLLYKYRHGFSRIQKLLGVIMTITAAASFFQPTLVATGLLWVGVFAAAHQPWKIFSTESTEGLEWQLFAVYLGSSVFWAAYGFATHDNYIVSWAIGYAVVYSVGLIVYRVYRSTDS
jgi:hypothetical protein